MKIAVDLPSIICLLLKFMACNVWDELYSRAFRHKNILMKLLMRARGRLKQTASTRPTLMLSHPAYEWLFNVNPRAINFRYTPQRSAQIPPKLFTSLSSEILARMWNINKIKLKPSFERLRCRVPRYLGKDFPRKRWASEQERES